MKTKSRRDFLKVSASAAAAGCVTLPGLSVLATNQQTGQEPEGPIFMKAVREGSLNRVKELVAANSMLLQHRDETGLTGYAAALLSNQKAVVEFLKKSGYKSDLHESALALDWEQLDIVSNTNEKEIVKLVNSDHPIGGTAMYAAAAGGAAQNIWRVYALCCDPNTSPRGKQGVTPIQKALRFPDLKTAEITAATLLSNNTDPNPGTNLEKPPLHIAAERGSFEIVEMLIRLGANVDAQDHSHQTALQLAEKSGHRKVTAMLKNHANVPKTCRTSRTRYNANGDIYRIPDVSDIPLFDRRKLVGQSHGNLSYVKTAVAKEPRMAHSVATTSEICVEACAHTGRKPVVEFLLKHGAPYSLPTAVMMNDIETVRRYLDEDPDRIQERGAHDFALLWYPVIGKCPIEMMELLFDRGVDVEQQHFLGTTALHWAVLRDDEKAVELLISKGADVNRVGRKFSPKGETPLMLARDKNITGLLKANGAK